MPQKKYEDYLEEMYKLFPEIEESSIKHIIEYGLKKIFYYVKRGGDVMLKERSLYLFIGVIRRNLEQHIASAKLQHQKYRRLFTEKKQPWDGYHYFGLTQEENEEFENGKREVTLYKLLKESTIRTRVKYVYRVKLDYGDIPVHEVPWIEKREILFKDAELSEEGMKNLKKRKIYEESSTKHI